MLTRREFVAAATAAGCWGQGNAAGLDPRGKVHIAIGIPDALDTLKTFVEAEGCFSPGFGTYGVYFWLRDAEGKVVAPTMDGVECERGLSGRGLPIPWVKWRGLDAEVREELCQVESKPQIVAARLTVKTGATPVRMVAALRGLGPAGGRVRSIEAAKDALLVNGRAALVAIQPPSRAGVAAVDLAATRPGRALSPTGNCWGELEFELRANSETMLEFVCPVLPGRRAARHKWVDRKQNAMVDDAVLNPPSGGVLQPDPGLAHYRSLSVEKLFAQAREYWEDFAGGFFLDLPDPRWGESMRAILAHAALTLNEGAPDVAVVNYNVFNRDGVYVANMMQKAGQFDLAETALDYFLSHPFNGRAYPESDNPGQVLWCLAEHWRFTHDREWLSRIYDSSQKFGELIEYYRTNKGPYWVSMTSLEFGNSLPAAKRKELKPGRCDGFHPEYTEAFDIAGLKAAAALALGKSEAEDAFKWWGLAKQLQEDYDRKFGAALPKQYGSYSVLWPCRLYPLASGPAFEQFRTVGAQQPASWRYFPLATAHQGLLAGNRDAAHGTLQIHLDHEQMKGWYAFDEGGGSGSGGWHKVRTNWKRSVEKPGENLSVAMPHGWAIAEFWLLMRDSLLFEDENRIVLFAGVPPEWFQRDFGFEELPTYWGSCSARWTKGKVEVRGAKPPGGFIVRTPGGDVAVQKR